MCYSCSSCEVANTCTGHGLCWLCCLSLFYWAWKHVSTSSNSVLCPGIDGLAVLGGLPVEMVSLLLPRVDVDGFIMRFLRFLLSLVSSLILVINTVCSLWNLVSSWCRRGQLLGQERLKCVWTKQIPGWQGVWKDLGRFLEWLSCPITWDLKPKHESNPDKLVCHLTEECFAYPSENQLPSVYWCLFCVLCLLSHSSVLSEGCGWDRHPATTVMAPTVKEKQWIRKTMGPYHMLVREKEEEAKFIQEADPAAKKLEEGVRQFRQEAENTWSLTTEFQVM